MTLSRPVKIILITLSAAALIALVVVGNITRNNSFVRNIEVSMDYRDGDSLVLAEELEKLLQEKMPWVIEQTIKEIDREEIRNMIESSPYVEQAEVSITMGCVILIKAVQRRPIVRVFRGNEEYYLDGHGKRVPLSEHGSYDVLVGSGNLKRGANVEKVWIMARYLDERQEYGCLFDQLYINEEDEIVAVPKIGNHIVIVGNLEDLDAKMAHLMHFYQKAMPIVGWEKYSQVSLKYRGQVICTKRGALVNEEEFQHQEDKHLETQN